ncbi:MAG: CPBP family intramembrane metalloprotease [Planctomycetes bacterium]|jgi:hypothetical protein|nr:CPBP family intramembrane metalloprotease [Planctomycetota bacterium]
MDTPTRESSGLHPGFGPAYPVLSLAFSFYGLLGLSGIVWVWIRTGNPVPASLPGAHPLLGLLVGGSGGLAVVASSAIGIRHSGPMRWLAAEVRGVLGSCSPSACFGLALASAVGEEFFFRGAMQPAVGFGLTSLAFGLVHIGPDRRFLLWTAFASVLGLGLGCLLEWTGSLLGCILAHFTINFLNLLQIMRLGSIRATLGSPPDAWHERCCGPVESPDRGRDD